MAGVNLISPLDNTVVVPFATVPNTCTEAGFNCAPPVPTWSLVNVLSVTAVLTNVLAISVFATGGLFRFGSNTLMVNVSVLQPDVCLGSQTGTSYTYSPGFVGENV